MPRFFGQMFVAANAIDVGDSSPLLKSVSVAAAPTAHDGTTNDCSPDPFLPTALASSTAADQYRPRSKSRPASLTSPPSTRKSYAAAAAVTTVPPPAAASSASARSPALTPDFPRSPSADSGKHAVAGNSGVSRASSANFTRTWTLELPEGYKPVSLTNADLLDASPALARVNLMRQFSQDADSLAVETAFPADRLLHSGTCRVGRY